MAFPAYAGMFPDVHSSRTPQGRFPRVCGDVSESYPPLGELVWLSPRMRGCFSVAVVMLWATLAFPAYAGMFLVFGIVLSPCTCFPRVCGDVSVLLNSGSAVWELSPRMRGCFRVAFEADRSLEAFPAYAGMFPKHTKASFLQGRFPRVCGDVSARRQSIGNVRQLSPRMRGCFFGFAS